jgi:hypothetical protein
MFKNIKFFPMMPTACYEWIFELKYCKSSASDAEIAARHEQATEKYE